MVEKTVTGLNDADTFYFKGEEKGSRTSQLGSPEVTASVYKDGEVEKIPNAAGVDAKVKAAAFVPNGRKMNVETTKQGPFGRNIDIQEVVTDAGNYDYAMAAFDQRLGVFESKYQTGGEELDEEYRIFQSTEAPFKIGANIQGLSNEEYQEIYDKRTAINEARDAVIQDPSEENQAVLDLLAADLYGKDKERLLRFHFMNHPSAYPDENGVYTMKGDPYMDNHMVMLYNARMQGGGPNATTLKPYESNVEVRGASDTVIGANWRKWNDLSGLTQLTAKSNANQYKDLDMHYSTEELLRDLNPEDYEQVMSQETSNGAWEMRKQLLQSRQDDTTIEQGGIVSNIAGMAIAAAASPSTYIGGALVKGGLTGVKMVAEKAILHSSRPALARLAATKTSKHMAGVANWITGGAGYSSVFYASNLATDPTATVRGYLADVAVDGAIGGGLRMAGIGNDILRNTKLGDFIGLSNEHVMRAMERGRDGYFRNIDKLTTTAVEAAAPVRKNYAIAQKNVDAAMVAEREKMAERVKASVKQPIVEGKKAHKVLTKEAGDRILEKVRKKMVYAEEKALNAINPAGAGRAPEPFTDELIQQIQANPEILNMMGYSERRQVAKMANIDVKSLPTEAETHLKAFKDSGMEALHLEELKPTNLTGLVGQQIGRITQDFTTTASKSGNSGLVYLGTNVLELGRGKSGRYRQATGSLNKARIFDTALSKNLPGYVEAINEYVASKGHGKFQRMVAQESAAGINKHVDAFGREFMLYMNDLRMGRKKPVHPAIQRFADNHFAKFTSYLHDELVDAGVAGFHAGNKLEHYVQHSYNKTRTAALINTHGEATMIKAIAQGIKNANVHNPHVVKDDLGLNKLAEGFLKKIRNLGDDVDQNMPGMEGSSKHRTEMDLGVEVNGFKLVDLVDNNIAEMSERYAHRASGLAGLARSTNGLIDGNIAWAEFKEAAIKQGMDQKGKQLLEDTYDMMMGRPTRGGLPGYMRSMRDMAVVTQMGNLGLNEIMEAGLTINKAVMQVARNPEVARLSFNASRGGKETQALRDEVIAMTGMGDDMAWLVRHGSHLDQKSIESGKFGEVMSTAAHYMTGGNYLPLAKRALNKTTGFDMARTAKHRIALMSMIQDIGRKTSGKGALTSDARFRDLGLIDNNGNNLLEHAINTHATFNKNGTLSKLNVNKWEKEDQDLIGNILFRAASQDVQRHLVGEIPTYLNNPIWNVALQYLSFPIVATNKQLQRSMQFADMEAVTGLMLNLVVTGTVQYAMEKGGLKQEKDFNDNTYKYFSSIGIIPEVTQLAHDIYNHERPAIARVPALSVLGHYGGAAVSAGEWALSGGQDPYDGSDAAALVPLATHATFHMAANIYTNGVYQRVQQANDVGTQLKAQELQAPENLDRDKVLKDNPKVNDNLTPEQEAQMKSNGEQFLNEEEGTLTEEQEARMVANGKKFTEQQLEEVSPEVVIEQVNTISEQEMKDLDREIENQGIEIIPLTSLTVDDITRMSGKERATLLKSIGFKTT